jgi:hypothetical protein
MIIWIILIILLLFLVFLNADKITNLHQKTNPEYYRDPFFNVNGVKQEDVLIGKRMALKNKIVLCGLCRNIEKNVSKNIELMEMVGSQFMDYKIVLFENDSDDQTREIIKNHSIHNPNVILLDCGPNNPDCKLKEINLYDYGQLSSQRIGKMGFFRNQYHQYIKNNLSDYDYVMMIDMDLEGYFNMDGLFETIAKPSWDAVFVNGRVDFVLGSMMYDSLAYVKSDGNYDDFLFDQQNNHNKFKFTKNFLSNLFEIKENNKWIPVKSAFNGCAIYKMETVLSSNFDGNSICEWINFHRNASANGKNRFYLSRDWVMYVGFQGPSPRKIVSTFFKKLF